MRKEWCSWATTLKFCINVQVYKTNYGQKYRPRKAHSNWNIGPRKTWILFFLPKWQWKLLLFIFVFSTLDLVENANNLENVQTLFGEIWGKSWKTLKLFKWVTRISHSQIFDVSWPIYSPTNMPKFVYFILQWCGFGHSRVLDFFFQPHFLPKFSETNFDGPYHPNCTS